MNKTVEESIRLVTEIKTHITGKQETEIVLAPPFTALHPLGIVLEDAPLTLCAQNMFHQDFGAYTGEISPVQLGELQCHYVILGHSERREHLGETNEAIALKIKSALDHEIKPVLCVGETKDQRRAKKTFEIIEEQLKVALRGVHEMLADRLVVAYEPVWAIGTGDAATLGIVKEVHAFIREKLGFIFRKDIAEQIRIIYGGSVTPQIAQELSPLKEVDGFLVGGASLDAQKFIKIILNGEQV